MEKLVRDHKVDDAFLVNTGAEVFVVATGETSAKVGLASDSNKTV